MARGDENATNPPQVPPTPQAPHTLSTIKLPIMKKDEYDIWAIKMEHYLGHTVYPIWEVIQKGNGPVQASTDTHGQIRVLPPKTAEEILSRERERKARTTLLMFQSLLSQLEIHGAGVSTEDTNQKFLRSVPFSWSQVSLIMRTKPGVDTLSFDDLYNNLRVFKSDVKVSTAYDVSTSSGHNSQKEGFSSYTDDLMYSFFDNQSSGPQLHHEDLEQVDEFDLEEMDLKWQVTMISTRLKKFYKKTGRKLHFDANEPVGFDKTKDEHKAMVTIDGEGVDWTGHAKDDTEDYALMAFNSSNSGSDIEMSAKDKSRLGYGNQIHEGVLSYENEVLESMFDSRSSDVEDSPVNDRFAKVKGMHASKTNESDANTSDLDSCKSSSSVETLEYVPKPVESKPEVISEPKVWSNAPIIEESFSHLIRDCDFHEKRMAKQVKLNKSKNNVTCQRNDKPVWNYVQRLNHQNKFVPTTILTKTGRFPVNVARKLFSNQAASTSTIKKVNTARPKVNEIKPRHNVYKSHLPMRRPFNRTTAPKAIFANHKVTTVGITQLMLLGVIRKLLLRPQQFQLRDIIPSRGFACLIAKATVDESNKWHRRSKGIKKECSNARTSQQNEVAERKNRTLIEVARTMLADLFLPNTFWVEAVSTAYYVLNRVLVTKPQNKTPYELLTGKIPIISYIRPFGCHATILNTIDHLGKFKEKSDEGFLVGYSLNIKAFRVYNLETKRVEENLHINFFKHKPNVAGKGPTWLFDLDYLTDSMNYLPVTADNKANKTLGPKEANNSAGSARANYTNYVNTASTPIEPKKISQALKDKSWVDAMQEELLQFKTQQVWILVDLPFEKKVIGTKWVYRNKKDERGVVVRNKARLVAQGHRQEEVIDYDEVFALVARIEAIRIFLAFASYMGFIVYQIDVKSAFLYEKINEEVCVSQPPGSIDPKFPKKVYKVVKALYGLHQALRAWYAPLSSFLVQSGYKRGLIDRTLFIKKDKKDIMLVQVYVDDIIFGSTKKSWCDEFEALMKNKFQMSSMGALTFFLRLQVKQKEDGIFINQDKYVAEILKKFDFISVKTASSPIETKKPLVKDEEAADVDVHLYRSIIGSLKGSLGILKANQLGLWYPRESVFDLKAYSDSDYAGANLDRKSTTRGCQFLGRRLISWQCKKQTIVATLTTKAEYVAAKKHKPKRKHIQEPEVPLTEFPAEHNLPSPSYDLQSSSEDSLKLKELMDLCTNLSNKVLDLESEVIDIKSTYQARIRKLKSRVERLEEENKVLKELRSVHSTVDANDPVMEKEKSSKQRRKIADIDADVLSMLDANDEEPADVEEVLEVVKSAKLITKVVTTAGTTKGLSIDEIRPLFEKHYNYNQAFQDEVKVLEKEKMKQKKIAKKQKMDQETEELKNHLQIIPNDDDDLYTDATPLASKIPIVDYMIHTERNRPYFKIIRADGNHMLFISFNKMMKNFDREDLKSLWKIIKERFEKIEPKNYSDDGLLNTLKIKFKKPNVEASLWKDQKGKYGIAKIFLLVERMYPLTHFTLEKMINNVRLKVEDESEMSLELLRLVRRQLNVGYVPQLSI
nr:retrovirus-related Pol polyprotein from transposon TNT 1-94 [Tanacetum cinerariifolium]